MKPTCFSKNIRFHFFFIFAPSNTTSGANPPTPKTIPFFMDLLLNEMKIHYIVTIVIHLRYPRILLLLAGSNKGFPNNLIELGTRENDTL